MIISKLIFSTVKKIRLYYEFINLIFYTHKGSEELKRILNSKNKEFFYVFDTSVSSLAYGDFIISSLFLRYISIFKKIRFIFLNDKIRNDTKNRLSKNEITKRIKEFKEIIKFICKKKCIIHEENHKSFFKKYNQNNNIYFKKLVLVRKPLYKINFNIINKLYPKLNLKKKNEILFKKEDFKKFKIPSKKFKNFITVGVRINYQNETSRNHDKKSIIKFVRYIKNKKKNESKKILLICDKKNLNFLKKIFKNDKNIFFSKDYTQSFLEDGYYILNSDFYYQYYGTGISVFAEFSKIKFEIYTDLKRGFFSKDIIRSDQLYNKFKKNSWQTDNQKFRDIDYSSL